MTVLPARTRPGSRTGQYYLRIRRTMVLNRDKRPPTGGDGGGKGPGRGELDLQSSTCRTQRRRVRYGEL